METDTPTYHSLVIEALKKTVEMILQCYSSSRIVRDRTKRKVALSSPELYRWIIEYYLRNSPDDLYLVSIGSRPKLIPFLSKPCWQGEGKVDIQFDSSWKSKADITDLVEKRRSLGYRIENRDVYCLYRITENSETNILQLGLCSYEQYVSTCGVLEEETLMCYKNKRKASKLRDQAASNLKLLETCPLGAHAMGVHTTVVFHTESDPVCLLQQRSFGTITSAGLSAVLPAFAFQPMFGEPAREFNLQHQFLREYGEEVLNIEELSDDTGYLAHDWFYSRPGVLDLVILFEQGLATISCTGFGFDAVNGEPNLSLLVEVKSPEYWENTRHNMHKCWESNRIYTEQISSVKTQLGTNPLSWAPGSVFSLSMALRSLEDNICED